MSEGILIKKGAKPPINYCPILIREVNELAEEWSDRSEKGTAKMLHRAIPWGQLNGTGKFVLTLNIPGGKKAVLPLETTNGGEVNSVSLQAGKDITVLQNPLKTKGYAFQHLPLRRGW